MKRSYGLLFEPVLPEDFVLGSDRSLNTKFSGRTVLRSDSDWRPWLPPYELQSPIFESNACASFGTSNTLEVLLRFLYTRVEDFSDRFLAKISGTDPKKGNSPKAVAEALRKNWATLEVEWPAADAKTVEEFYAEIPENLKTLALGRKAEWDFGYEYVGTGSANIREALKYSPLGMSVPAWFKDENGKYYRPAGVGDNHWITAVHINEANEITILDSYEPFIKVLRSDFSPQVAFGYYLNRQIKVESAWDNFLKWLRAIVFKEPTPPAVTIDHTVPPAPTVSLEDFCLAIRAYEGWFPGSRSFKNNNPGNCRFSTKGYLAKYLPVLKDDKGFAVFKNYATGWTYLQNLVREKINAHPEWTLKDFFNSYAPSSDGNNPLVYAGWVAKQLNVDGSFKIKGIVA